MKNLTIKTTGWEMTDEIANYLEEKVAAIERILPNSSDPTVRCDVELAQTRDNHASASRAEMNLSIGATVYRAEATGSTMQEALDTLKDEMQRQLRHGKNKNLSLLRQGGAAVKRWLKFGRE